MPPNTTPNLNVLLEVIVMKIIERFDSSSFFPLVKYACL